jgi:hypothetical protein
MEKIETRIEVRQSGVRVEYFPQYRKSFLWGLIKYWEYMAEFLVVNNSASKAIAEAIELHKQLDEPLCRHQVVAETACELYHKYRKEFLEKKELERVHEKGLKKSYYKHP